MSREGKQGVDPAVNDAEFGAIDVDRELEFKRLLYEYKCSVAEKPEWCIMSHDGKGGKGELFWIRPSSEGELVARRIAKYLNSAGGSASAEMTKWNPNFRGTASDGEQPPTEKTG